MNMMGNMLESWYRRMTISTIVFIIFLFAVFIALGSGTVLIIVLWYWWYSRRTFLSFLVVVIYTSLVLNPNFDFYRVRGWMETTLLEREFFLEDKVSYWFRKPRRSEIIAFNDPTYHYSSNRLLNLMQRHFAYRASLITRVIGIPGDYIKGVIEDGHPVVYLNQKKLDESSYLNKYPLIMTNHYGKDTLRSFDPSLSWDNQPFYKIDSHYIVSDEQTHKPRILEPGTPHSAGMDTFDRTLGENQYWVMGDNRLGSLDSRNFGPVNGKLIQGKIVYRVWSWDPTQPSLQMKINNVSVAITRKTLHFWNREFWRKIRWERCFQRVH